MQDLLDFGNEAATQRATARTNALAVTRDYISQPRLSELIQLSKLLSPPKLNHFFLKLIVLIVNCIKVNVSFI